MRWDFKVFSYWNNSFFLRVPFFRNFFVFFSIPCLLRKRKNWKYYLLFDTNHYFSFVKINYVSNVVFSFNRYRKNELTFDNFLLFIRILQGNPCINYQIAGMKMCHICSDNSRREVKIYSKKISWFDGRLEIIIRYATGVILTGKVDELNV